jgi:O-antigen/teichoic acid export membrane protein
MIIEPEPEIPASAGKSNPALRHLLGAGSIYATTKALHVTAAFLVLPLLTRVLAPAEYGAVATALVISQLLSVTISAGMPISVSLAYFRTPDGPDRSRTLILWTILGALAIVLLIDVLGPLWGDLFFGLGYATPIRVAVWTAVPIAVLSTVQAFLQVSRRARLYAGLTVLATAGGQCLGLVFVHVLDRSASAYLFGAALAGIIYTGLNARGFRDWRPLASAVRKGLPTMSHDLSQYLISAGDRLVLVRLLGLSAVGRYQIAYAIGALGMAFVSAFAGAWAPLILAAPEESRWQLLADSTMLLYRISALVLGGLAIGAPIALKVIAPASYDPDGLTRIAAIVSISMLPYVLLYSSVLIVLTLERTGILGWATPFSAVANVALNFLLVPHFGIMGSAVATVTTFSIEALILRSRTRRLVRVPWQPARAFRWWSLALGLAAAGGLLPTSSTWLVLRGILAGAIVAALVATIRRALREHALAPSPS